MSSTVDTFLAVVAAFTPILLLLLGGLGRLYLRERDRLAEAERQVSEKKYQAYVELLGLFFDVMKDTKQKGQAHATKYLDAMWNANKNLMLYGSDSVLLLYQAWLGQTRQGTMDLEKFGELVVAIRQDMGNARTKITAEHILRQLLTDYDEMKTKGMLVIRQP